MYKISVRNYIDSYEIGTEFKKQNKTFMDFYREYDIDDIDEMFFNLGLAGKEKPVKATGWRYGDFSDFGKSRNKQNGKVEPGLSLMEIFVEGKSVEKASTASALFMSNRKRIKVKGYWTPDIWGSDGEPLMLLPKHIS